MSGFRYSLIIEFDAAHNAIYTVKDFIDAFEVFLKEYFLRSNIPVTAFDVKADENSQELLLYSEESDLFPITSFRLTYELYNSNLRYIRIIDWSSLATSMMNKGDFFSGLIALLNEKHKIKQAAHLTDPVFKDFKEAFEKIDVFKREHELLHYYRY